MLRSGLESIERQAKTWTAFHPDATRSACAGSGRRLPPTAPSRLAPGIAEQANFHGVFAPVEDQASDATAAVAKCLRGL